jgi:hypothetical protein
MSTSSNVKVNKVNSSICQCGWSECGIAECMCWVYCPLINCSLALRCLVVRLDTSLLLACSLVLMWFDWIDWDRYLLIHSLDLSGSVAVYISGVWQELHPVIRTVQLYANGTIFEPWHDNSRGCSHCVIADTQKVGGENRG